MTVARRATISGLGDSCDRPALLKVGVPDREQHVSLSIYDLSGRVVTTLVDRRMSVGGHAEEWDARDNSGNPVATGVYFYRLTAGSRTLTRKAVLLK